MTKNIPPALSQVGCTLYRSLLGQNTLDYCFFIATYNERMAKVTTFMSQAGMMEKQRSFGLYGLCEINADIYFP